MKSPDKFAETISKVENLLKVHKNSDALALCDGDGHTLFFEGREMFLATGLVAKSVATYFSDAASGSTFMCSDPYSGGTSTFDLSLIHVFLVEGKTYYLVSTKTYPELNQSFRTVNLPSTVDAEGIRIPPVCYFEKNGFNKELAQALDGLTNDKGFSQKLEQ